MDKMHGMSIDEIVNVKQFGDEKATTNRQKQIVNNIRGKANGKS